MSDTEHLQDFLLKRSNLEMIIQIGRSGASFTEIKDNISISHNTLSKRLKIAQELNVIEKSLSKRSGEDHKYVLTQHVGFEVLASLEDYGIIERFYILRRIRKEFNEKCEEYEEFIERRTPMPGASKNYEPSSDRDDITDVDRAIEKSDVYFSDKDSTDNDVVDEE